MLGSPNSNFKHTRGDPVVLGRNNDADGVSTTQRVISETEATHRVRVSPAVDGGDVVLSVVRSSLDGTSVVLSPEQALHIADLLTAAAKRAG